MEEKIEKPTLGQLWQDIKKHKKLYYKVLGITFIVSAIITLSIPNYYKCTVMLAPEIPGGNKGTSGLASLASSFGVNLGGANAGADAIMPNLYPDLMNSVTFRASLFPIKVHREGETETMTYYDYLKVGQKTPWWSQVKKAFFSFFAKPEPGEDKVNTFKLTKEQTGIIKLIGEKVVCDVDKKTLVITIDVTDQDPLIAATMADSVQKHLQEFITDYRTRKARVDLAYNQKLFKEAQQRYEKARLKSAAYTDANRHAIFAEKQSEQTKLENEMQLQYRAYSQVAAQLQLAEAKVQEETPAFTILQPATVPIKKEGPKRTRNVLIFLFLALLATTVYTIHKENHLICLLSSSNSDDDFDEDDLLKALVKLSTPNPPVKQN
ncbi:MAG: chain-length determining protein [Bacteroidaceae bacterium]|nr:chain-length determining protein [Bacteroidaceae bacterium]